MSNENTIAWATRPTNVQSRANLSCVDLLHPHGGREANRMLLMFESGPYRYRMAVDRVEDGRFEGPCQRCQRDEERLLDAKPIRCLLLDSLEEVALVTGLSPWVDDNQQESDWLGPFKKVHRVILQTPTSAS